MARHRPRKRNTAVAIIGLTLSKSAARDLYPSFLAVSTRLPSPADAFQHCCLRSPPATAEAVASRRRSKTTYCRSNSRHGARLWPLKGNTFGSLSEQGRESSDNGESEESEDRVSAAAAVLAAATAAAATAESLEAPPTTATSSLQDDRSREAADKRRAVLRRMRRKSNAKIKSTPPILSEERPAERRARKSNKKKRVGSSAAADVAQLARNKARNVDKTGTERQEWGKSWGGEICGAVFGRPTRFFRRKVDACKSFVASRQRIHWASLGMAAYIATTSVVPRLATSRWVDSCTTCLEL